MGNANIGKVLMLGGVALVVLALLHKGPFGLGGALLTAVPLVIAGSAMSGGLSANPA